MNKAERKLIFLWHYLDWGGAQIYFLAIIKEARKDWDVLVLLPRKSNAEIVEFIKAAGVKYEFIDVWLDNSPAVTVRQKLKRQWRRIHAEIYSYFYLRRFDLKNSIVHAESAPWQSWIFYAALALRGNVFVTVHNTFGKNFNLRGKIWKFRLTTLSKFRRFHIFAGNQDAKNCLKNFVAADFWNKMPVTYTSVNPPEIEAASNKPCDRSKVFQKLGVPKNGFNVLCVGQFVDRKGRWIFTEAAEKVRRIDETVSFIWLMPVLPDEAAREKIKTYALGDSFHPILSADVGGSRADILEFIRLADVYALPSLIEGLPISLLEAMALKVPSISTAVNSIPEAVKHLKTGWLIQPNDSDELAEAILTLKNNRELSAKLAQNGCAFVLKNFDERETAQTAIGEYDRCFEQLI